MKTRNKHLAISTLALAMVLIIACGEETGVNNGSTVPNDTSAVVESSSGTKGGGSSNTGKSSGGEVSSDSHTGTSSSGGASSGSSSSGGEISSSSSAPTMRSSSSTCVDGEEKYIEANDITLICRDGRFRVPSVDDEEDDTPKSPYYDSDDVFLGGVNQKFTPSEFLDDRDGQTYKTAIIQPKGYGKIEYFAQNLNYGEQVMLKEGQVQTPGTKYCYNDDPLHCEHNLGGLYTWSNAMGLPAACDTVAVGSEGCPSDGML